MARISIMLSPWKGRKDMNMFKRLCALIFCVLMLSGTAGAERLSDQQLMTYYQNTVVVGDSIPRMLRNYIAGKQETDPAFFADMRFFTYYSYKLRSAAREFPDAEEVNLVYKGTDYTMCQLMGILKPDKAFVLAGLNDKIGEKIDKGMEYVDEIMRLMAQYAPQTKVYFFSLTPVTYRVEEERPKVPAQWNEYNARLREKCEEVGAIYVEIAEPLKNEKGLLPMDLSHDGQYHLNDEGNAIWVQSLLDFAQSRYDAGLWSPENGGY